MLPSFVSCLYNGVNTIHVMLLQLIYVEWLVYIMCKPFVGRKGIVILLSKYYSRKGRGRNAKKIIAGGGNTQKINMGLGLA